jgi:hypothetical protein
MVPPGAARARGLRIAATIMAVTGITVLAVGCWLALQTQRFQAAALRAEGEVVRLTRSGDGAAPVFRFSDAAGASHEVVSNVYTTPPAWRIGERAVLLYDPAAPGDARPDSFAGTWLLPVALLGLALFEWLAAAVLFGIARRQARMP